MQCKYFNSLFSGPATDGDLSRIFSRFNNGVSEKRTAKRQPQ